MATPSLIVSLIAVVMTGLASQPEVPAPADAPVSERGPTSTEAPPAPALSAEDRQHVLDDLERTLRRRAFVLGVDFQAWPERLAEVREKVDEADEPRELTAAVNRALLKFGISHLRLSPPSAKPAPAAPGSRQPGAPARNANNQTLTWLDGDIALLRLRSFDDDQYDRAKIEGFFDEISPRARGIILDLRGNGGGAVTAMSHLLGLFLPAGTEVGVYVNRGIVRSYERAQGRKPATAADAAAWTNQKYRVARNARPPATAPVAVLISRNSASASEIVAAALRDHARAALIGQPSAGKVLLSTHAKLWQGFELQLPTADYVTSRGLRLEGNALKPSIPAPGGRGGASEQAVRLAADLLLNGL